MKKRRIVIVVLILIFLFSFSCRGEEFNKEGVLEDIYSLVPEDARSILSGQELLSESLDTKGFFSLVIRFFKEGFSSPFSAMIKAFGVLIIAALMNAYSSEHAVGTAMDSVCLFGCGLIICIPIYEIIAAAKEVLSSVTVFITASVPIFAAVKAASGSPVSVSGGAGVLLFACQAIEALCAFLVVPFMNSYLAVGICASCTGKTAAAGIMKGLKKVAIWVLSFCFSIFVFILGAKGIVGKSADNFAIKTAQFLFGTTIPVVGQALSDSASSVAASLSVISSSAGVYIIIAAVVIILPLILELACWWVVCISLKYCSEMFSAKGITALCETLESVISLLFGFCVLSLFLITISLGVLISL